MFLIRQSLTPRKTLSKIRKKYKTLSDYANIYRGVKKKKTEIELLTKWFQPLSWVHLSSMKFHTIKLQGHTARNRTSIQNKCTTLELQCVRIQRAQWTTKSAQASSAMLSKEMNMFPCMQKGFPPCYFISTHSSKVLNAKLLYLL